MSLKAIENAVAAMRLVPKEHRGLVLSELDGRGGRKRRRRRKGGKRKSKQAAVRAPKAKAKAKAKASDKAPVRLVPKSVAAASTKAEKARKLREAIESEA